jgi:ribonuclease HI
LRYSLDDYYLDGYYGDIMTDLTAFIDGGTRGKPRSSGIGVVMEHAGGRRVEISQWIGADDNNYAEYAALLVALEYAVAFRSRRLQVFSDSEVVVKQIRGEYSCQSPSLRLIHQRCKDLIGLLDEFAITHIRREFNSDANRLVGAAMERAGSSSGEEFLVLFGLTPPVSGPAGELQAAFAGEALEN